MYPVVKKRKHMKRRTGHPLTYTQEIDDELLVWVLRQRDVHLPVRRKDIKLKAAALVGPGHPNFKAL